MAQMIGYESPLGLIGVAAEGGELTRMWFQWQGPAPSGDPAAGGPVPDVLSQAADWLDRYFDGAAPDSRELPLSPRGTAFRRLVWDLVRDIPYGEIATYGEVADRATAATGHAKMAAQAIGGAVKANPLMLVVPCHRVVAATGLGGYGGHLSLKVDLLRHEGVDLTGIDLTTTGL